MSHQNTPLAIRGQVMLDVAGTVLTDEDRVRLAHPATGGVILFSRNYESPEQVAALIADIHALRSPPLLIAVDQEGGTVARLKSPFTEFPGNARMKGPREAVAFARVTARELLDVGINMNMAPVLDVAVDPATSIMQERAFGADPQWVSRLGMAVIQHLQEGGVMSVAKHFPGIGRTTLDSHLELPFLETSAEDLAAVDLVPFQDAVEKGVAGMMLAHICYRSLDDRGPASLSKKIARDLLRHRLGYEGVVMTDDLDMGAVKKHHDIQTMIQRILAADIDIALICHRSPDMERAFETIRSFQSASPANRTACEGSLRRILALKKAYLGTS